MFRIIPIFLFVLTLQFSVWADVFEMTDGSRLEGRLIEDDGVHIKLNLPEYPDHSFPVFIYNAFSYDVKKTHHPTKIEHKYYKESKFLVEKGNNYFFKKDYRNAIRHYEDALKVNPKYIYAYHNIAVSWLMMNEYNNSINAFNKLIGSYPENGYAYLYLTINYMYLENYSTAKNMLSRARNYSDITNDYQCNKMIEMLNAKIEKELFPK